MRASLSVPFLAVLLASSACQHVGAAPEAATAAALAAPMYTSETAQPFTLAALPYGFDALAPVIDAETMQIHHGRHHKAYVDNLNAAIGKDPRLEGLSLEAIVTRASEFGPVVRNNAGGHWNHTLFWTLMAPAGQGGAPSDALSAAITRDFGSLDAFKKAFEAAGVGQFGSGWAWLIVQDGKLVVTATPNQDNPLMDSAPVRGTPILGNDVWEHAYYLSYQNRRAAYLTAWWDIVNWNEVNRLYAEAAAG